MTDTISPAMQQFYDIKEHYKDSILFFRMWDFYEMFDDDANIAHRVLWIAVTTRNKNAAKPIPLAWIPYHAKEKYLPLLIEAWYKVAIAEQVSDPKLKGIVKREVVRVVTPSTLNLEWESYDIHQWWESLIVSISSDGTLYWMSSMDISTHEWKTSQFENFDLLESELYKISPKEVILDKSLFWNTELTELLSKKYSLNVFFHKSLIKNKRQFLTKHFWVKNLEWFWIENYKWAIQAASLLLEYLQENQKSDFSFLQKISYESFSGYMDLDEATIKNLDLVYNFSTKSDTVWTLFWVLNHTKTLAWKRLLRDQILHPLQSKKDIESRQRIIEELLQDKMLFDSVLKELWNISDIDAILNRLALSRALPRDLLLLKKSLQSVVKIVEIIKKSENKKLLSLFNTSL